MLALRIHSCNAPHSALTLRRCTLAATAFALLALAACAPPLEDEPVQRGVAEVVLRDSRFTPRVIEVKPGTRVTWTWDDGSQTHDVAGDDFQSQAQQRGTFAHMFEKLGTYDYLCHLHGSMTGRVIVKASAASQR